MYPIKLTKYYLGIKVKNKLYTYINQSLKNTCRKLIFIFIFQRQSQSVELNSCKLPNSIKSRVSIRDMYIKKNISHFQIVIKGLLITNLSLNHRIKYTLMFLFEL